MTPETTMNGIEKAMTVSRMPAVVGEKLLAREAEGLRNMPKADLTDWRLKRLSN